MIMITQCSVGPLNGRDMTAGGVLFAQNRGTSEGLVGYCALPKGYITDSVAWGIGEHHSLDGCLPICPGRRSSSFSHHRSKLHILLVFYGQCLDSRISHRSGHRRQHDHDYILSRSKPYFGYTLRDQTRFREGELRVSSQPGLHSWPGGRFWEWGDLNFLPDIQTEIASFVRPWLLGMVWGVEPTKNALSEYLSVVGWAVGTGRPDNTEIPGHMYAEHLVLGMLTSGVSMGFSHENLCDNSVIAYWSYEVEKTQYYVGLRSPVQPLQLIFVAMDEV